MHAGDKLEIRYWYVQSCIIIPDITECLCRMLFGKINDRPQLECVWGRRGGRELINAKMKKTNTELGTMCMPIIFYHVFGK